MKKTIVATLILVAAGFCGYSTPLPVDQVGLIHGCAEFAGTNAAAIATAEASGSGTQQYIISSTDPLFDKTVELASQSVVSGKNVVIESSTSSFIYKYSYNGTCYAAQGFKVINSLTLKRQ